MWGAWCTPAPKHHDTCGEHGAHPLPEFQRSKFSSSGPGECCELMDGLQIVTSVQPRFYTVHGRDPWHGPATEYTAIPKLFGRLRCWWAAGRVGLPALAETATAAFEGHLRRGGPDGPTAGSRPPPGLAVPAAALRES